MVQKTPPNYPLEKITNQHIALIYGLGDWLADPKDVQLLKNSLTGKALVPRTSKVPKIS